jgi:hypothetical protein
MRCPVCQAANPAEAPYCVVCGERLPDRAPPMVSRPKARPDVPIALAFLVAGAFFVRIKSVSSGFSLWDILAGLLPATVYGALFLVAPLQDWVVDPWLLRVGAIAVGGLVLFGDFEFVFH